MHKYGGTVVFRTRDAFGTIEVIDDTRTRSLHFGSEPKQSTMDLHDPTRLELTYTRAMAMALLFLPGPRSALLVGLGGGSLAKFLLHHTAARIDAVELRPEVARVARDYFRTPDDPRLTIIIADAGGFMATPPESLYDLVFVDAYDAAGMSHSVRGEAYIEAVHARLGPGGIAAFNLWTDEPDELTWLLEVMKGVFGNLLLLPVEGKANLIALCGRDRPLRWELRHLSERAKTMQEATGMEFVTLLKSLRKHNALTVGNLFS